MNEAIDVANRIFRWASPKSMKEGKWIHPGFNRGKDFLKASMLRTKKRLGNEISEMTRKVFK